MKKRFRRILLLLAAFLVSTVTTALLLNIESTDNRQTMNHPTMAEVMVDFGGSLANLMVGYAQPMQTDFIRDSVTPLDTSRTLDIVILPYEQKIYSLSYEVRSSDGSKVIENRKIKTFQEEEIYLRAQIEIGSDLRLGQEYSMQLTLDTEAGLAYYYTRVVPRPNLNVSGYVQFVRTFVDKSLDKQNADDLSDYLETELSDATVNFANIDIHSTINQISWGYTGAQMYRRSVPVIKDINETTASIAMEYQIMVFHTNEESGEQVQEIYDVTEFYRLRFDESRVRLLDFERSARQVFAPGEDAITSEGLILGVRDRNVTYVANSDASVIAFVQEGDLWTFSPDDGKAIRVFTFRMPEDGDRRDARCMHDIQIIRVDDNGDVDFVLYGYMNRGKREGYSGVCVYHYSNDQNVIEEKVFLPVTESYEFLARDMKKLSYVSKDGYLYLLFSGKLYQVGIEAGSFRILEEGIGETDFAVSATHAHAAWRIQEGDGAGCIREIDLDTLKRRLITPGEGRQLRLIGFMNEDVIYGILRQEDILTDAAGHSLEGYRQVRFEDPQGQVVKKYTPEEGEFITGCTLGTTLLEFEISAKAGTVYEYRKKDNILNNSKSSSSLVSVELTAVSRKGIVVRLAFGNSPQTDQPLVIYARTRSADGRSIVLDPPVAQENSFYVYAKGGLDSVWTDPAAAIQRADEMVGVVLNYLQQYVWERGNRKTSYTLDTEDVPEVMRQGVFDLEKLTQSLSEDGQVLDLTGCSLDSILYEVSAQRPVYAMTGQGRGIAIVGYDPYNTWLLNPDTQEVYAYGMDDSETLFGKAGNVFITVMDQVIYDLGSKRQTGSSTDPE